MKKRKGRGTAGHYEVPGIARIPWDELATKNKTRHQLDLMTRAELDDYYAHAGEYTDVLDDNDELAGLKMGYRSKDFDKKKAAAESNKRFWTKHRNYIERSWRRAGYDGSDPYPHSQPKDKAA